MFLSILEPADRFGVPRQTIHWRLQKFAKAGRLRESFFHQGAWHVSLKEFERLSERFEKKKRLGGGWARKLKAMIDEGKPELPEIIQRMYGLLP